MKIGVDIRTLMDVRKTGVPEYTFNFLDEILKLDNENEYRLFSNSLRPRADLARIWTRINAKVVLWRWPNKILNYLLFKVFNRPKIDSSLGVDIFFMPHINFISLSKAKKSILTIHDLSFLRHPEYFSMRKNFWHRMINVKKLVNKFDYVIAVSEHTKKDIIELCGVEPDRIKVIYSGIGEEFRVIEKSDRKMAEVRQKYNLPEKFILFLGTIEPRKNIEGIIGAYNQLRITDYGLQNYKLVIAGGKGWKTFSVFDARAKSSFKDDIIMLGYVDKADKPYLYNLASIFVYPSFYEGFGFPPLEALACGLPVVTSFSSSLPEVVGDSALLVDPYDINDISKAIENILMDENLRINLRLKGFRQAEKFKWRETAKKHLEIFQ